MEGIKGSKIEGEGRSARVFGLTTVLLVAVAIVLVGAALLFATRRSAGSASVPIAARHASWQPEPSLLFQHAQDLDLNAHQRRHVQVVIRDWDLKKASFDVQLRRFQKTADQALADLASPQPPGGDYGKVLVSLEAAREAAWTRAIDPLTPEQKEKVQALQRPVKQRQ